ncbi:MAG TPA: hypothetical protein VF283_15665 [Bryobacteraceae bacterium]
MDSQQRAALDTIGAEPLEDSGFESETPVLQEEFAFTAPAEQKEGERQ